MGRHIGASDDFQPIRRKAVRASSVHMTKEKFQQLCKQVLVPLIGGLLHRELTEFQASLDAMADEMIRLGKTLDEIAAAWKVE